SAALARGGLGAAFAEAIKLLLKEVVVLGVVGGIVVGALNIRPRLRVGWGIALAIVTLLLDGYWLQWQVFALSFIAAALPILLAIFFVISDAMARPAREAEGPEPGSTSPTKSRLGLARFPAWKRYAVIWVGGTYAFWAVLSLANLDVLLPFVFPPAIFFGAGLYGPFLPFLVPVLIVSMLATIFICYGIFLTIRGLGLGGYAAPFLFNAMLLVTFLVIADFYRKYLMSEALATRQPEQFSAQ